MFLRIYASLIIAAVLASFFSYGFYQWQYHQRYAQHIDEIFVGSFSIIDKGLSRHEGENRERWLGLVQRMLGAGIEVRDVEQGEDMGLKVFTRGDGSFELQYFSDEGVISSQIQEVTEQHYRLLATLITNELGRAQSSNYSEKLNQLQSLFGFPIELVSIHDVRIDGQQLSRLKRFDTVVTEAYGLESKIQVYTRLPNSNSVLKIGPLASFTPAPLFVILMIIFLAILITGLVAYIMVQRIENRLGKIEAGVTDFSGLPVKLSLDNEEPDAIGQLAGSVNSMTERIHQLLSDQKQMLQAISHELRTPISRVKFRLELMDLPELSKNNGDNIHGVKKDINEIELLINEASDFNRGENLSVSSRFELGLSIKEIMSDLLVIFPDVNFQLNIQPAHTHIHQDKMQTRRIFQNIMQNACKYGRNQILISIKFAQNMLIINIEDNGLGISDENKISVFSPFIRLDTSRNKKTGGLGLGLAIVKHNCDIANFPFLLKDSEMGGVNFEVHIPLDLEH